MSLSSPRRDRFSREGFERLTPDPTARPRGDATIDIPLQDSPSHQNSPVNEKAGLFHRPAGGFRRSMKPGRKEPTTPRPPDDDEVSRPTWMGGYYSTFLSFSVIIRYILYIIPIGLLIAIPIIIGASAARDARIGSVRIVWFFTWIEICWCGLWVSRIFAHYLPAIFQFLAGVVSSGTRKYALVLSALEMPLSFAGWALISLSTFMPVMTRNPTATAEQKDTPHWMYIMNRILAAALICTLVFTLEKFFIQLISINYHRKQFNTRIKDSKRNIYLLGLLYDASRSMFPQGCPEFAEEDAVIEDSIEINIGANKRRKHHLHKRSGSSTPLKLFKDLGTGGNKFITNIAKDMTGKQLFDSSSAHSIIVEALEKNRTAEALARRLWLSFVIEGNDALFIEDVIEVLGMSRENEAEEAFLTIDRDGNGDISLDEMILAVAEFGRERHAINNSMHDVDQAIKVLDRLLCTIVFVAVVFIFVAFLNTSFVTTLATAGTALLSLSFVFSTSAQEVLGSCIFLFVKHPYDIGDRVDVSKEKLVVEHISLLFTVFRRITNNQTVQIPNIVLNSLWVENVSRSRAMREQLTVPIDFASTFEDVQLLKSELQKFVLDKENSRDFMPDVDIQVVDIAEMNKLSLQIDLMHKSNWANETVRASRRSKLMCALVLALRKVPINGPGGGGASLGSPDNPTYSVAVSDAQAADARKAYSVKQETARLVPTQTLEPLVKNGAIASVLEKKAMSLLTERKPTSDSARDHPDSSRDADRLGGQGAELEEVRGVLRRETTKGRRKSGRTGSTKSVTSTRSRWTNDERDGDDRDVPDVPSINVSTGSSNPFMSSQGANGPILPAATYPVQRYPSPSPQHMQRQWPGR